MAHCRTYLAWVVHYEENMVTKQITRCMDISINELFETCIYLTIFNRAYYTGTSNCEIIAFNLSRKMQK